MTKDDKDKASLRHIDTTVTGDGDAYGPKGGVTIAEVNSISAWQSIKLNPKIVFWSLFANSKKTLIFHHRGWEKEKMKVSQRC